MYSVFLVYHMSWTYGYILRPSSMPQRSCFLNWKFECWIHILILLNSVEPKDSSKWDRLDQKQKNSKINRQVENKIWFPQQYYLHNQFIDQFFGVFLTFSKLVKVRWQVCKYIEDSFVQFNPLTSMSDQDRISPYIINTMSSRLVIRLHKNIS